MNELHSTIPAAGSPSAGGSQTRGENRLQRWARLKNLSPLSVLAAGLALYLVFVVFAPVDFPYGLGLEALLYLLLCFLAFAIGASISISTHARVARRKPFQTRFFWNERRIYWTCTLLGLAGFLLRAYDRYALRGLSFELSLSEKSEILLGTQFSAYSAIAAPLFPFLFFLPFCYLLYARRHGRNIGLLTLAVAGFIAVGVDNLLTGSRSVALVTIFIGCLYFYLGSSSTAPLRRWLILGAAVGTLSALGAGAVFLERLSSMGIEPSDSIIGVLSGYAETVPAKGWIVEAIAAADSFSLSTVLLFSWLHISQYYIHGVFEFSRVFDYFLSDGPGPVWGAFSYYVPYKTIAIVLPLEPVDFILERANPRSGVYSTFFSSLLFDFGWIGPFIALLYGCIARGIWLSIVRRGALSLIPIYAYILVVIFFFPLVDLFSGAIGQYYIFAGVIFHSAFGRFINAKCGDAVARRDKVVSDSIPD